MSDEFEIGSLVIDNFKVVKYLGYEEHDDDNYHRLLCLDSGEYLSSAVYGPRNFKGTEAYDESVRVWKLNEERMLSVFEENKKNLDEFLQQFKIYEPIIHLAMWEDNSIKIFDSREAFDYVDYVNIDCNKLSHNETYKDFLTNYIETIIKKLLSK